MAPIAAVFKNGEELKTVEAIHKTSKNLALADSIADCEA